MSVFPLSFKYLQISHSPLFVATLTVGNGDYTDSASKLLQKNERSKKSQINSHFSRYIFSDLTNED